MAYSCNKLSLRTMLRNVNLKSQFSIFGSFRHISVLIYDFLKFVVGLLGQSIGIDENNKFLLHFQF